MNSIQAKLDKIFLQALQKSDNSEDKERPNDRILKEYNGEPFDSEVSSTLSDLELENYRALLQQIEDQNSRILLTLENFEQKRNKN